MISAVIDVSRCIRGWAVQLDPQRIEKAQDELCKLWERKTKLGGRLSVDEIHIVDRADLEKCLRGENTGPNLNKAYCRDAMAFSQACL